MNVSDGVQQVVGLVDDDHSVLQVDADCLPGGRVEKSVVGEDDQLAQRNGRSEEKINEEKRKKKLPNSGKQEVFFFFLAAKSSPIIAYPLGFGRDLATFLQI